MNKKTGLLRAVLLVSVLAGGLRFYAARTLYGDDDESTYMKRAVDYANFIRSGQFNMLASYNLTYEHPALYKILYGIVLLTREPIDTFHTNQVPRDKPVADGDAGTWILADRYLSAVFGTLATAVTTLINPLAGLFLGINTLSVKYTSEVYLEALPLLTSLLCAASYLRWFKRFQGESIQQRGSFAWLAASAFFLGLTAASKYVYCVVGIAVTLHFGLAIIQRQIPWQSFLYLLGWAVLSLAAFFMSDPYLWPNPSARLIQSIQYNFDYSHSQHVLDHHYPFWQPLRWLSAFSSFYNLGPRLAFIFDLDTPIFMLAVIGLPRLFRQERFFFYWLAVAVTFLLLWNTKWPQYALIALPALGISAAQGWTTILEFGRKFLGPMEDPVH
jgi:4-amino-4-deoxy-L-arabinose transferase-like glycosyltransferase